MFSESIFSEVSLDGSSGSDAVLSGLDYSITPELGQQVGNNLFHSFRTFNIDIDKGESATFIANNSITNIIGRVTGGSPSFINGMLRTTHNANLFLINPAGLLFGSKATLNINGSFYASTAHYIRFDNNEHFDSTSATNIPLLVNAKPEAFGFLGEHQIADVQIMGSQLNQKDKMLSIIAGDISITNSSNLLSKEGSISLISVKSPGEIDFYNPEFDINRFSQMGRIHITRNSDKNEPSRIVAGNIVIRGGELTMDNSRIQADPMHTQQTNKTAISIALKGKLNIKGEKSQIRINGDQNIFIDTNQIQLEGGAQILTRNNKNNSNSIILKSGKIIIDGRSDNKLTQTLIRADKNSNIQIKCNQILLSNGGGIRTTGGGNIEIVANDSFTNDGINSNVATLTPREDDGGYIELTTGKLNILNGARISTTTTSRALGDGGKITIHARNIHLQGATSSIQSETRRTKEGSGRGGNIDIYSDNNITIEDGAFISANTEGPGIGGNIELNADSVELNNQSEISTQSLSTSNNAGKAGLIIINSNENLLLSDRSKITVETQQADAGNINISTNFINIEENSVITTSAAGGKGNGGDINLDKIDLLILNSESEIIANAQEDSAGNITIKINDDGALLQTSDSVIEASNDKNINGNIDINAPDTDITSRFKPLPSRIIDASTILQKPCAQRFYSDTIHFVNQPYEVLPDSPYALRATLYDSSLTDKPSYLRPYTEETTWTDPKRTTDYGCRK